MDDAGATQVRAAPGWARTVVLLGAAGVTLYVASWLVAGLLRDGYDPLRQAISELYALDTSAPSRVVLMVGLGVSAVALTACGPALHRVLPGADRPGALVGPVLVTLSGLLTLGALAAPCSRGCPGFGTTTTDTLHVAFAGTGYLALILGPLVLARRVRGLAPTVARAAVVLCGLALVGFVVRNAFVDALGGLQQRTFNTLADAWYVAVAAWAWRRRPRPDRDT